jgi:hypothetical protein
VCVPLHSTNCTPTSNPQLVSEMFEHTLGVSCGVLGVSRRVVVLHAGHRRRTSGRGHSRPYSSDGDDEGDKGEATASSARMPACRLYAVGQLAVPANRICCL